MRTVLFLCTGNSCRSQVAEALVNHFLKGQWTAYSAGTEPAHSIHPLTLRVLAEIGIDHRGSPKGVEVFKDMDLDLVMTVCEDAAENCPVWLGKGKRAHLSFPDPGKVKGTQEEQLQAFRAVREDIHQRVFAYLEEWTGLTAANPGATASG